MWLERKASTFPNKRQLLLICYNKDQQQSKGRTLLNNRTQRSYIKVEMLKENHNIVVKFSFDCRQISSLGCARCDLEVIR